MRKYNTFNLDKIYNQINENKSYNNYKSTKISSKTLKSKNFILKNNTSINKNIEIENSLEIYIRLRSYEYIPEYIIQYHENQKEKLKYKYHNSPNKKPKLPTKKDRLILKLNDSILDDEENELFKKNKKEKIRNIFYNELQYYFFTTNPNDNKNLFFASNPLKGSYINKNCNIEKDVLDLKLFIPKLYQFKNFFKKIIIDSDKNFYEKLNFKYNLVHNITSGINSSMFFFGLNNSGKTYLINYFLNKNLIDLKKFITNKNKISISLSYILTYKVFQIYNNEIEEIYKENIMNFDDLNSIGENVKINNKFNRVNFNEKVILIHIITLYQTNGLINKFINKLNVNELIENKLIIKIAKNSFIEFNNPSYYFEKKISYNKFEKITIENYKNFEKVFYLIKNNQLIDDENNKDIIDNNFLFKVLYDNDIITFGNKIKIFLCLSPIEPYYKMNLELLNWGKNLGNNEIDDNNYEFYKNKNINRKNLTLNNFYKKFNIDNDINENEIYTNSPKNDMKINNQKENQNYKNDNNNILLKRYKDLYNNYIKLEKIYKNTCKEIEYLKNNNNNNTFNNNK